MNKKKKRRGVKHGAHAREGAERIMRQKSPRVISSHNL